MRIYKKDLKLDKSKEWLRSKVLKQSSNGYPVVSTFRTDRTGKFTSNKNIYLHHCIIGHPLNNNRMVVDHINGDKLDNRSENLRIVSRRTNMLNTNKRSDNKENICQWRGYYFDGKKYKQGKFVLNSDITREKVGYFAHKDEQIIARLYEYFVIQEEPDYPLIFPLLTDNEVADLLSKKSTKNKDAGNSVRITWEEKRKRDGKIRYRIDVRTDGKCKRTRKVGLEEAIFFAKDTGREYAIIVNEDKTQYRIEL